MKTKKPSYKGELAKPIYVGSIPIEATNEEQSEWIEQVIKQEMIEKLPLLFQHYRIPDKDDYFSLAFALAMDYVPGFQVKQTALKLKHGNWGAVIRDNIGAPVKWPRERLLRLLNAVEEPMQKGEFSTEREALQFLMLKGFGRPDDRRDEKKWLETLESRLHDAKRIRREEQGGGPALDHASAAILRELEEAARLAATTVSAATVYSTLPVELRLAALCLPLSSKIPEIKTD
jgi:hypothetical protein